MTNQNHEINSIAEQFKRECERIALINRLSYVGGEDHLPEAEKEWFFKKIAEMELRLRSIESTTNATP